MLYADASNNYRISVSRSKDEVNIDDPNITIEEYIRLEEEKARRRAIVFNDTLTFEAAVSCRPTVSSLTDDENEIRISFDESDDEDYTLILDKNMFSYKIISVNDLKTDLENDNDKVNIPLFPPPEPTEVIESGNSWVSVPQTTQENGVSVTKMSVPVTAEEKINKKNDVKARSLIQKIISRLVILAVVITQEDLNSKFLRSLPPEWNTHSDMEEEQVPTNMALMAISDSENEVPFSEEVAILNREVACKDYEINVLKSKPQKVDKGFINSRCSRHMTRNITYLSDFKEVDRGYVNLGEEHMVVEFLILFKIPRKDNKYSFDMKNIVPKESLTCLVAKAALDESRLWHRRLGHINFKNINKLVQDNLVRGLLIKHFENDQTYVACLKGKQHRASLAAGTISDKSAGTQGDLNDVEDGTHNEDDDKDKSEDDISLKEVNDAGSSDPHSPTDMFKLGASDTLEATHVEFFSNRDSPEVDLGNIPNSYRVPTTLHTRIHKDHLIKNVISEVKSSIQVEAIQEELLQFKLQQEEVYVTKPQGFKDLDQPDKVYKVVKALYRMHQAPRAWKSTTGGCQFLGNRLISWQCKKQTVVATSTTEAEYVAAASCCRQGIGSGSGPRCQNTILGDVEAQTRFEAASKQFNDPPLSRVNTLGCEEDNIKLKELMDFCTKLSE
uniref:Ribonuclease H-like domain-containing protein n=1 Tax=Tanacetum cinerariifolium TaxID=118510 RepID=A0A6L2M8D7_TANCI|nr:ribonuclease H-like domain-containing protein [Tanacetum cinerariifolium]